MPGPMRRYSGMQPQMGGYPGKAVHVDPMKPMLKSPGKQVLAPEM